MLRLPVVLLLAFAGCSFDSTIPVGESGLTQVQCDVASPCPAGLVCAPLLGRCYDPQRLVVVDGRSPIPCEGRSDCPTGQACAQGIGQCVVVEALPLDAGVSTLACTLPTDCPAPLACAAGAKVCVAVGALAFDGGVVALSCRSSPECPLPLTCARAIERCVDPGAVAVNDAGLSNFPCSRTDDCPAPLVCSPPLERCVDVAVITIPAIGSVDLVRDGGVPTRRLGVLPPFHAATLVVRLLSPATRVEARFRGDDTPCVEVSALEWRCPILAAAPSGSDSVTARAFDVRGVSTSASVPVTVDAEPPRPVPGTTSVQVLPDSMNPLASLGPAFAPVELNGTSALRLTVVLDDPNTEVARVRFGGGDELPLASRAGQAFTFVGRVPSAVPDGLAPLLLSTSDDVGNALAPTELTSVGVDRLAPAALEVASDAGLLVERLPFGNGARRGVYVSMPMTPPGTLLFRGSPTGPVLLATRGGVPLDAQVAAFDLRQVFTQVVDGAGNPGPVAAARQFRLTVTPGGDPLNPSIVTTTPLLRPPLDPAAPVVSGDALVSSDGRVVRSEAVPVWRPLIDGADAGPVVPLSSWLLEDPIREELLEVSAEPQRLVLRDVAGGRNRLRAILSNPSLEVTQTVAMACSQRTRGCLMAWSRTSAVEVYLVDDLGFRSVGAIPVSTARASVTWSPDSGWFLVAASNSFFEFDEAGVQRTSALGCHTECSVLALPDGLLTLAGSSAAFRFFDGGGAVTFLPGGGGHGTLLWDRNTSSPVALAGGSVFRWTGTSWVALPMQRAAELGWPFTLPCSSLDTAGWDPLSRRVRGLESPNSRWCSLDGGPVRPPDTQSLSGGLSNTRGSSVDFFRDDLPTQRYVDGLGWTATSGAFPLARFPCAPTPATLSRVVAFDGGFLSPPCSPFWVSDTPFARPTPVGFMLPGQFITTVQDRFLTTNAIWADGGTRVFAPLPSPLAVAVPLSPSAVATWNQNSVITYSEQPDGGWSVLANRPLIPFPAPTSGPALMGFPVSADHAYGAFDRMGRLSLLRLDRLRDPAPVPATEVTAHAPWGQPVPRSLATVAALSGEAFLVAAGQTASSQPLNDIWRLTTTPRPAVTWRLPLDALPVDPFVLRTARVQARFEGPARAELRAWDPWRSQWVQAGRATADSGFVSGAVTVFNGTLDVAVDLPPTTEPLLLDRLQASFDYVQP